jgi:hypothetical protein
MSPMSMSSPTDSSTHQQYALECQGLPLAVYREIVAHLQQVTGVEAGLTTQTAIAFDYTQSQVGHLWIRHLADLEATKKQRLEQILQYYSDRFGPWQQVNL